jgi:hypothetical protein
MTHPGVDLSAIGLENRRMTHAGIPPSPVRSDWVRPVPLPVRKKPYRLQLSEGVQGSSHQRIIGIEKVCRVLLGTIIGFVGIDL